MGVPPMRYDINSLRSAEHIAPQAYRIQPDISQIPSGIYIAASHKWLAKPGFGDFEKLQALLWGCGFFHENLGGKL